MKQKSSIEFARQMFLIVKSGGAQKTVEIKSILEHWISATDCQRQLIEARGMGDKLWELELAEARDEHLQKALNLAPELETFGERK